MSANNLHVILADDDDDDRLLFTEALEELPLSVDVTTFDNGVSLMDYLLKHTDELPDIIFLDLNMPLMNGEECLRDIRNEPELSKIPIIIYSTSMDHFKVIALQKNGADRYLQKPSSYSQLKNAIMHSIESVTGEGQQTADQGEFVIKIG